MVKKVNSTGTRAQVWHGTAKSTTGGLHKGDLMKNKHGRIVSKKKHALGKKALKHLHNAGYVAVKGKFGTGKKAKKSKTGKKAKKSKTSLTKAMFNKLDSNKDRVIDYSEFIKGLKSQKGGSARAPNWVLQDYGGGRLVWMDLSSDRGQYDRPAGVAPRSRAARVLIGTDAPSTDAQIATYRRDLAREEEVAAAERVRVTEPGCPVAGCGWSQNLENNWLYSHGCDACNGGEYDYDGTCEKCKGHGRWFCPWRE